MLCELSSAKFRNKIYCKFPGEIKHVKYEYKAEKETDLGMILKRTGDSRCGRSRGAGEMASGEKGIDCKVWSTVKKRGKRTSVET